MHLHGGGHSSWEHVARLASVGNSAKQVQWYSEGVLYAASRYKKGVMVRLWPQPWVRGTVVLYPLLHGHEGCKRAFGCLCLTGHTG